ncbi:DUF3231 family protein [Alkalibacillus salilacus]|uniref:DUF3231 family protein n=1 Tax=Alkalibacillus salilacus TaxID=284582 RepID=A0ABT9VG37_9BACI|nr:DUF3231 family protein [Alkalibacillus salilacus]MDQ0159857.1 hypothetical protein [Alkalibacillus salilacus]
MAVDNQNLRLTASEITNLWTAYMNDSGAICQLKYFEEKCEDTDIKPIIQHAIALSQSHLDKITEIFNGDNYPVPYGFKIEEDVDLTAGRLFSDVFVLYYLEHLGILGLNTYSMSLPYSPREDVHTFFSECLAESDQLLKQAKDVLLEKGVYNKGSYLSTPDEVDFVKKQNFLSGYFGDKRPLTGPEITNLNGNYQRNALGTAMLIGFSQVANKKEVREFCVRGKEIAQKHCDIFSSILSESDVNVPSSFETEVTDATTYVFSDKLMMYYTTTLIAVGVAYYGASMSMSPRRDLVVQYDRLLHEILLYAEDGAELMIKHGWLEEPPRALDRDELAKKK